MDRLGRKPDPVERMRIAAEHKTYAPDAAFHYKVSKPLERACNPVRVDLDGDAARRKAFECFPQRSLRVGLQCLLRQVRAAIVVQEGVSDDVDESEAGRATDHLEMVPGKTLWRRMPRFLDRSEMVMVAGGYDKVEAAGYVGVESATIGREHGGFRADQDPAPARGPGDLREVSRDDPVEPLVLFRQVDMINQRGKQGAAPFQRVHNRGDGIRGFAAIGPARMNVEVLFDMHCDYLSASEVVLLDAARFLRMMRKR